MRDWIDLFEGKQTTYRVANGQDAYWELQDSEPTIFRSKRIRYLDAGEMSREVHVIAEQGRRIVGMAGMQVNPHDPEQLWIKFISVDPEYQGQGIGKELLRQVYCYADQQGHRMAPGGFTEEGERLRHLHVWDREFPNVAYQRNQRGDYVNSRGMVVRSAG